MTSPEHKLVHDLARGASKIERALSNDATAEVISKSPELLLRLESLSLKIKRFIDKRHEAERIAREGRWRREERDGALNRDAS